MKNVIVANFNKDGSKAHDIIKSLKAQSLNAKEFKWSEKDFIIVSNHEKVVDFGTWIKTDLNKGAFTASKLFAVKYLYENNITEDSIWAHDLDLWQNSTFIEPNFKDAGFCHYSRPKINGGCQFWKKSGLDIINKIIEDIALSNSQKEEPSIQKVAKFFQNRITILNSTYNVGCSGYVQRFEKASKPIIACHFHPNNRIAWQTHYLDRNGLGFVSVSDKLKSNLSSFFSLAETLDDEGVAARNRKISERH